MELYDITYTGFDSSGNKVTDVLIPHSTVNL